MKVQILLCSVVGLIGISTLILSPKILTQNSLKATIATTPKNLPQNLETAVRENMALPLQINSKSLKLTKSEIATWEDCLPNKSGLIPPQPCQARSRSGWRITMSGQGEKWVYYVTNNGFITLDAIASLNNTIISTLSKKLAIKPNRLRIVAAQLTKGFPDCPINATCKVKPILGWRVLVEGREKPFLLGLDGKDLNYGNLSLFLPKQTAQMPRNIGVKVLEDVVSRHEVLTSNLRVESIKPTKWNWCQGGGAGPSRPEMGTCPNIEVEGWQMIVTSGANRYVYYISKNDIANHNFSPIPDGMQSLPNSIVTAIQKDAAKRGKVSVDMIRLHWTTPQFFDRCLNIDHQKLNCRQSVQAGWQVTVLGGNNYAVSNLSSSIKWIYNVNLVGNDIRFLQSGEWYPVP
ncbi:hypothetical protein A0J48_003285 [Sphaerospermopsis aphanizomenoides BCCUSP55]|uniref:hypothetical protein n=1 Tax=Sphaerospermopsis aphanizomenoides TaxID=459663 RepID=UPI001905F0F5|nr:hypothetical protein [Sphaerospermopsis aphanizomenoides]MBK1986575.1 hypothetical protein [Sphaerospermopsis aphanizomenoides BCCUSP55]